MGMRRLTTNTLSEEVLNQLDIDSFISLGGDGDRLKKILNDIYQYHPKCFAKTNKGDLSFLKEIVGQKIYILKFI